MPTLPRAGSESDTRRPRLRKRQRRHYADRRSSGARGRSARETVPRVCRPSFRQTARRRRLEPQRRVYHQCDQVPPAPEPESRPQRNRELQILSGAADRDYSSQSDRRFGHCCRPVACGQQATSRSSARRNPLLPGHPGRLHISSGLRTTESGHRVGSAEGPPVAVGAMRHFVKPSGGRCVGRYVDNTDLFSVVATALAPEPEEGSCRHLPCNDDHN